MINSMATHTSNSVIEFSTQVSMPHIPRKSIRRLVFSVIGFYDEKNCGDLGSKGASMNNGNSCLTST